MAAKGKRDATAYYLTLVRRPSRCEGCGRSLTRGQECVYRHSPQEILCPACSEARRLEPKPSRKWEQRRKEEIERKVHKQETKRQVEGVSLARDAAGGRESP